MYDWDDAYSNSAYIPGSETLPDEWAAKAHAYRCSAITVEEDLEYGSALREKLDIVWPDQEPCGLAVFVHGGYWMSMDKSFWTHFAEGARSSGWAVCIPGYTIAPEARIHEMTGQIGRAIGFAAQRVKGPVRIAGHSAGGHLVSRMACADTPLDASVRNRLEHVLSISGLHDLRPIMSTSMNKVLCLDEAEARNESPALLRPRKGARLTAWVGGAERPEFLRQARLLEMMWQGFEASVSAVIDGHHNHFSVLEGLSNADSAITHRFIKG
jgi:acetyl esterase/lipase